MSNTFCGVAVTELRMGERETAARSVADERKGCETATRYLSDPKYRERIPKEQHRQMTRDVQRLRERLERFKL